MDIERIKHWISYNTEVMLHRRQLEEQMELHNGERNRLEDELIEEGDKLNALTLEKERRKMEMEMLEERALAGEEEAEARIMELEEELYQLTFHQETLMSAFESCEDSLNRHYSRLADLQEEAQALNAQSQDMLKFPELKSVHAARMTLEVFFSQLLDLNLWKRDLENKCIQSGDEILDLQAKIDLLNKHIHELQAALKSQNMGSANFLSLGGSSVHTNAGSDTLMSKAALQASKVNALKSIVSVSISLILTKPRTSRGSWSIRR